VAGTSEPVRDMESCAQQLRQPGRSDPEGRVITVSTVELDRQPGACWGSHSHPPVASCPEGSMLEFIALNALAVLLLGIGVLIGGHLLAALGWLVVRGVRRSELGRLESRTGGYRAPGE